VPYNPQRKMSAYRQNRAPRWVGLAPILLTLLLVWPAPLPVRAAGTPPPRTRPVPDIDWVPDQPLVTYIVQPGDSLSSIASRYGTRVAALQLANRLSATATLRIGRHLAIPVIRPGPALVHGPNPRRGLAMAVPRLVDVDHLGVGWYYTWQWCTTPGCLPMVYQMELPNACAPIILVGNEPNAIRPSGWPVSPTLAAELVRTIEVQCPGSQLVVGNVAADDWSSVGGWGSGRDWLFAAYTNRQPHTGQGWELSTGVELVNSQARRPDARR
jgi:hypothetical protein